MTAVLAIDFIVHILILADCRVSWSGGKNEPQDNLQKVYPLGPTGVLGFAGDVSNAKKIVNEIRKTNKNLPPTAMHIAQDISKCACQVYSKLPQKDQRYLELMYVALDYGNVNFITKNAVFANRVLTKMVSPKFKIQNETDCVRLGYAKNYPIKNLRENRDNLIDYGIKPGGIQFQSGIAVGHFGKALVSYSPTTVGGMFCVGTISKDGINWSSYTSGEYELIIQNGKFVQIDKSNGRVIPLKTLLEFDPNKPDVGNNRIDTNRD